MKICVHLVIESRKVSNFVYTVTLVIDALLSTIVHITIVELTVTFCTSNGTSVVNGSVQHSVLFLFRTHFHVTVDLSNFSAV